MALQFAGDVRAFGASGDGVADDTQAIQQALDTTRGALFFPAGRYRTTAGLKVNLASRGINVTGYSFRSTYGPGAILQQVRPSRISDCIFLDQPQEYGEPIVADEGCQDNMIEGNLVTTWAGDNST